MKFSSTILIAMVVASVSAVPVPEVRGTIDLDISQPEQKAVYDFIQSLDAIETEQNPNLERDSSSVSSSPDMKVRDDDINLEIMNNQREGAYIKEDVEKRNCVYRHGSNVPVCSEKSTTSD